MPQISKIRIVNFYYNNGHRMIPDELYDITDAEGKHALDTLISLINGGGKSVLVQLMMQPALPAESWRAISDVPATTALWCSNGSRTEAPKS